MPRPRKPSSPFRYFNSSPEVIRLAVLMYVKYPLFLRNVEDLLHERGIDISHETVRHWWNRFGPLFAADIQRQRVNRMRGVAPSRRQMSRMDANGKFPETLSFQHQDNLGTAPRLKVGSAQLARLW
jgi:putative transposase